MVIYPISIFGSFCRFESRSCFLLKEHVNDLIINVVKIPIWVYNVNKNNRKGRE